MGRLNGVSYDANIAGGGSMHVKADGVNSAVGRLGFGIGKETEKSNIFAKLALAHEFSGKMNTTYSAPGNPTVKTELDLKDTWLDAVNRCSWSVRPSTYLIWHIYEKLWCYYRTIHGVSMRGYGIILIE